MTGKTFDTTSNSPETRMPKCVVFDLDYTLWDLWIDTHISPPLRRTATPSRLEDRNGQDLEFYKDVPKLLQMLKDSNIHVAVASRTSAPELAREALAMMMLPAKKNDDPVKAISFFKTMEIYPGSKLRHFREIHKKTKIPYEEMLFFDDESRNKEVEQLGVTMYLINYGTNMDAWEKGLAQWRRNRMKDTPA